MAGNSGWCCIRRQSSSEIRGSISYRTQYAIQNKQCQLLVPSKYLQNKCWELHKWQYQHSLDQILQENQHRLAAPAKKVWAEELAFVFVCVCVCMCAVKAIEWLLIGIIELQWFPVAYQHHIYGHKQPRPTAAPTPLYALSWPDVQQLNCIWIYEFMNLRTGTRQLSVHFCPCRSSPSFWANSSSIVSAFLAAHIISPFLVGRTLLQPWACTQGTLARLPWLAPTWKGRQSGQTISATPLSLCAIQPKITKKARTYGSSGVRPHVRATNRSMVSPFVNAPRSTYVQVG